MQPNVQEAIPKETAHPTEVMPMVPRHSGRVVREPKRYMFMGESSDLVPGNGLVDLDPISYSQAVRDEHAKEWHIAMDSEYDSITAMDVYVKTVLPDGCEAIGSKWIYKKKRGVDGEVTAFKARLVAKGYTQVEGIDYDETFSPVAMLKSIRILLAIAAHLNLEVWQMDVKTAFLNGYLEEGRDIYMQQPEGYVKKGEEHLVWKLKKSIYGLKQASRSWNLRFNEVITSYGFIRCENESCIYRLDSDKDKVYLALYVDDILLVGNNVELLSDVKKWLSEQFQMKDLGDAAYILGIQVIRDRKKRMLSLSQASYVDTVITRFSMETAKKGLLPFRHGIPISKEQCPRIPQEIEEMRQVPYASVVGSLMYAMLCTRPDICYAVGMVARYQSNPGQAHWTAVKHILKFLKRTRDYRLVYQSDSPCPLGYTDSDFQADRDKKRSTSGYVFTLGGEAISWRSAMRCSIVDSNMEAEHVAVFEATKEAIWLRHYLLDLDVVPNLPKCITVYCDNTSAVANSREPKSHKETKHIERKYHIIREIVSRGDVSIRENCNNGKSSGSIHKKGLTQKDLR